MTQLICLYKQNEAKESLCDDRKLARRGNRPNSKSCYKVARRVLKKYQRVSNKVTMYPCHHPFRPAAQETLETRRVSVTERIQTQICNKQILHKR